MSNRGTELWRIKAHTGYESYAVVYMDEQTGAVTIAEEVPSGERLGSYVSDRLPKSHALSAVELDGVRKITVQIRNDWSVGRWIRVWASQDPIPNDIETEEFGKTAQFLEAEPVLKLLAAKCLEIRQHEMHLAFFEDSVRLPFKEREDTLTKALAAQVAELRAYEDFRLSADIMTAESRTKELEAERARVKELEAALQKIASGKASPFFIQVARKALGGAE